METPLRLRRSFTSARALRAAAAFSSAAARCSGVRGGRGTGFSSYGVDDVRQLSERRPSGATSPG